MLKLQCKNYIEICIHWIKNLIKIEKELSLEYLLKKCSYKNEIYSEIFSLRNTFLHVSIT